MSAEKPETPQEFRSARLVEAIRACRTHKAAQALVASLQETGAPPRRRTRSSLYVENVAQALAYGNRLLKHSDLVDHLVTGLGIEERHAVAAIFEAYDMGLVKVFRRETGTYYGAA